MQAYISGWVPFSATDWSGKRCMVIFFSGCDFKCPFCRTPEILGFKEGAQRDLREIKREISKNSDIDSVLFTGAEPCLQKLALLELAKFCKDIGLFVGIETNGSRPDVLQALLDNNFADFIRLDVKAPLSKEIFSKVTDSSTFFKQAEEIMDDFAMSLSILRESEEKIDLELRTTIVPTLIFKREDILNMAAMLKDFKSRWVLQKFVPQEAIVGKKFSSINPPSDEFLENLQQMVIKEFPRLNIQLRLDMSELSLPPKI